MNDDNIIDFTRRFDEKQTAPTPVWEIMYAHTAQEIHTVTVEGFYVVNAVVNQGMIVPTRPLGKELQEPIIVFPLDRLIFMHQVDKVTIH